MVYYDKQGDEVIEYDLDAGYRAMLDDVYGDVVLGDAHYAPSEIIRELSPTDYRIGFVDYIDGLIEEGELIDPDLCECEVCSGPVDKLFVPIALEDHGVIICEECAEEE